MEIIRANAMDAQNITTGEKRTILAIKGKDGKDGIDGGVSDVKINGTSIIDENHEADIPVAKNHGYGVVSTANGAYGIDDAGRVSSGVPNGRLLVRNAEKPTIDNRNTAVSYDTVGMRNLDYAVEASMGDGKAPAWSEQHQANARTRMGAASATDLTNATSYAAIAERLYNNTTTLTDEQKLKIETWLGLSENYLTTYNETPYQVTGNYNPAHKKYVDGLVNELQLFKFPNATIIGEPTINNGQISGFSATSYLKFPFLVDFNSRPFEINMEFTTGSNVTNQENIFDSDFGLAFAVRNSRFVIAVSTNGTSWNLGEGVGTYTVLANTTYRVKLWWDRMAYHLSYSVDGGNTYTEDITKVGAFQPAPKQMYIGVGETFTTVNNHFTGIINMNHCNLSINGQLIWQGMDDAGLATRLEIDMSNIDADGIAAVKRLANNSDIPELTTTDKTVVGAINEINSKGAGFVYESLGIVYPWSYNVTNQYVKASTNENLTLRETGIRPFTEENVNRDFLFEMEVPDRPAGPSRSIMSGGFRGGNELYFNLYYGDYAGGNVYFDMKDSTGTKSRLANFNEYNNTKVLKITLTRKSGKYNIIVTADGTKVAEALNIELSNTDYSNGQICIGGTFYSEGRYENNTIQGMTVNYARFRYES